MSRITNKKDKARKEAYARRKEAHTPERSALAAACLLTALEPHKGKVIAGYMPIRSEANPLAAMEELSAFGPVVVPVIQGDGLPLIFREWTPGCEMLDGPFGALVPAAGEFLVPEVVIVPMVAFDAEGGRLGYGGGYYDRTLEELQMAGPCPAIGYAYAAQEANKLPREKTDILLDMIVTEEGVRRFG